MNWKQLSLFDDLDEQPQKVSNEDAMDEITNSDISILLSALAAKVISDRQKSEVISKLANQSEAVAIAHSFSDSGLVRELRLRRSQEKTQLPKLTFTGDRVIYQNQEIGKTQILYKSALPGELQARLSIESAIDRFLEYLQKQYQIAVLHESDYHVQVFIPHRKAPADFSQYWREFIENIAFSTYGHTKHNLPGLVQTFIVMLNSVTLAGRGFSTLEIPILTQEQSNVLAAWYLAVVREVKKRQTERQKQIKSLQIEIDNPDTTDKDRNSSEKKLLEKEEMQLKEAKKYNEAFQKSFGKVLEDQQSIGQELNQIKSELADSGLTKAQRNKLHKQQDKLVPQIIFTQESVQQKIRLLAESDGEPFKFIQCDRQQNPARFKDIVNISKSFTKTATDQINATRGDIFTQCILEMYRLLENPPSDPRPEPLLSEQPSIKEVRSAGDDGKDFCYSCGVTLPNAKWKVARFMFERPSQRRQSSSSEDRPYICASCSALAFASPLKVTDESIILKLEPVNQREAEKLKVKDYIRMLTNKELHLSAGRYVVLASDRTGGGDLASQKLGQVQYALAKVASIFPLEVLADFKFSLIIQGSQPKQLASRHLVFIKGFIEGYNQSIVITGKEINMTLGDAVRYIEDDLPFLAEYAVTKAATKVNYLQLEKVRQRYWEIFENNLESQRVNMNSSNQPAPRAKLYRDVTALTGLTYAFAQSLESTAKKAMKIEDAEREVSKIIEKVDDAVAFCYYATLGDEKKTNVQARLYCNPENYFVYEQTKKLLEELKIFNREDKDNEKQQTWLTLYADDVMKAYTYFAENGYSQEREWKELTYNLKLSLYTRFPELVRPVKSTTDKN
ncbi:hypothetical protein QUA74_12025 [Microcoleus sp. LAD1_D3]|uniref:hypothetical protein n=1 Tax=Microcoleus sp. LAD1_D3 TaxID=2819365 RepID=UPI002FD5C644